MQRPIDYLAAVFHGNVSIWLLLLIGLITRLPFLSVSLDEVDSGNFYNALKYGYDISNFRPHAPGYPLYIFLGWLLNHVIRDYLTSLTLLSAVLGSLSVIPFYLLLKQMVDYRIAISGSLLFLANPLFWVFSETALADVPAIFFGTLSVWLMYKGVTDRNYYMVACMFTGLAVGIRQANITLVLLLLLGSIYFCLNVKRFAVKEISWGVALFTIGVAVWFFPMIVTGSDGLSEYIEVTRQQWTSVVNVSDVFNVEPPSVINIFYRIERFFLGYHFLYSWTGTDTKSAMTLVLVAPWLFGFFAFVSTCNVRYRSHLFILIWVLLSFYPILSIHFLPRYGLFYFPAMLISTIVGFHQVFLKVGDLRRCLEVALFSMLGTVLILYVIKHQHPVNTFEVTPPLTDFYVIILILLSLLTVVICRLRGRTGRKDIIKTGIEVNRFPRLGRQNIRLKCLTISLLVMVIPYGALGITQATVAHSDPSPSEKLVSLVENNYKGRDFTVCWDNQTHSLFDASDLYGISILGHDGIQDLYDSYQNGNVVLMSDRCKWIDELDVQLDVREVASFQGKSPLWVKVPSITLYESKKSFGQ